MSGDERSAKGEPAILATRTLSHPLDLTSCAHGKGSRGLLMEVGGSDAGRAHRLGDSPDPVTIGRDAGCSLVFEDSTLSRVHARILCEEGDWILEDAGSRNGTWVNNDRVQRVSLDHGDRVRLGYGVQLLFQQVTSAEEDMLVRLYEAGVRDGLTGIYNRRYLTERLEQEVAFAVRHETGLGLLMLDLDHFKAVNDSRGHLAGDAVLQHVARLLRKQVRREDVLARYGGEEFTVVLRDQSREAMRQVADRIRAAVEAAPAPWDAGPVPVTVSIGLALLSACSEQTPAGLLAAADAALYRAKDGGRNRVEETG